MYNYVITRISCRAVCRCFFVTGTCLGGAGGLLLGMMERQLISILGGAFLGLLAGVACALAGLVLAGSFNVLAPLLGGIPIQLETLQQPTQQPTEPHAECEQQSLFPGE